MSSVAQRGGLPGLDRVAVVVEDRPAADVPVLVLVLLVQLGGEGVAEEVEHVLARGDVDRQVVPLVGRDCRPAGVRSAPRLWRPAG